MRKLKQEGDKKGVKGLRLWTENKLSMTVFKKKKFKNSTYTEIHEQVLYTKCHFFLIILENEMLPTIKRFPVLRELRLQMENVKCLKYYNYKFIFSSTFYVNPKIIFFQ